MSARLATVLVVAAAALAAGCQEVRVPGVYRIDIQQGNVITQDQLAALEKGMEKRKVLFILGTPLVADTFNQDRWDYYYSIEKRGEDRKQRIVSVFFEDERLVRVGGDVLAALGPIEVESRKDELVTVPEGYRDQGLFAALTPEFLSNKAPAAKAEAEAPAGATGTAAEQSAPQSQPALTIDPEDERYLRQVLAGFGRAQQIASSAPESAPAPAAGTSQAQGEEEGIFSRWAKRLGLTKEEEPPAPAPPPTE